MNKAVIYCRQSSGDNDESESIEIQKQKCLELAQKEGLTVVNTFDDLNTSGKTYPTGSEDIATFDVAFINWYKEQTKRKKFRDGLGEVIKLLPEVDYIIVYDYTRLARPITGSFLESHISQLLSIHDVKVWTVTNGIIDLSSFNDSLLTALTNRINHAQISLQRKKAIAAFNKLKDSGELKCGIWNIWGYTHGDKKRQIKIVEREAEFVKDVFNTFLQTDSIIKTAKLMNEKYTDIIPKPILPPNFKHILEKPLYSGYMYNSSGELIKCKQTQGIEIIPFNTWKEVQRRLNLRKVLNPRPKKTSYPLSGILYCGKCGRKMTIHKSKNHNFYFCINSQVTHIEPCRSRIHASYKSKGGVGILQCIYPLLSLSIIDRLNISMNKAENEKELNEAEIKLQNLKNKEKNVTDLYLNGTLEEITYKDAILNIKKDKDELNKKIDKLKAVLNNDNDFIKKAFILLEKIHNNSLDYSELYSCIHDTIKRIDAFKDEVKITTIYGSFSLPRQIIFNNQNLLPHYYYFPNKLTPSIYYYMGEKKSIFFNEQWKNSKHKLIANLNDRMKVYLIK